MVYITAPFAQVSSPALPRKCMRVTNVLTSGRVCIVIFHLAFVPSYIFRAARTVLCSRNSRFVLLFFLITLSFMKAIIFMGLVLNAIASFKMIEQRLPKFLEIFYCCFNLSHKFLHFVCLSELRESTDDDIAFEFI